MDGKGNVVELYGGLGGERVASGVLLAYQGRIEEGRGGYCVADEAEDIVGREVNCQTMCRAALPVEDGLWIE